jgi:16S rRNA C1402 (ribose-2'-O) methylase RsmI
LLKFFAENPQKLRGEFVIIVEKAAKDEKSFSQDELLAEISKSLAAGVSLKDLSQNLSEIFDINKKDVYGLALEISKKDECKK